MSSLQYNVLCCIYVMMFSLNVFQFSFMSFVYTFCTLFCSRTVHCGVVFFNRELKSTLTPCSDYVFKNHRHHALSSEEIRFQFSGKISNDLNNILNIDEIPDPDGEVKPSILTLQNFQNTFKSIGMNLAS